MRRVRSSGLRRGRPLRHLGEGVPAEAGLLRAVALLDDLAAPGGHRAEQQALPDGVGLRPRQLGDVADDLRLTDPDALAVALKLQVALETEVGVREAGVLPPEWAWAVTSSRMDARIR